MEQGMSYKTFMVSLALDRPNDACLSVAGDLAERFGARVIGIAASDIRPTLYFAEGDYAQKVLEDEGAAVQRRLSELEAEFRTSISKRAKSVEWRSAPILPIPYVMQHARAADVFVVGARAEAIVDPCVAADPSDLVMQAGRPHRRAAHGSMARFEKRADGLEGRKGSPPSRIRCAAHPGCGKRRYDR
jgi:hypothetical protein